MKLVYSYIVLGALLTITGCAASSTANTDPTTFTSIEPNKLAQAIPQYPPLYEVGVRVCGDIVAQKNETGKRCVTNQLHLWGPVGKTQLVQTGLDMRLMTNRQYRVAIQSKGCYPVYKQPGVDQFYWADMTILVNKGGKTLVESKVGLLSNEQVHEIVTNRFSGTIIPTFGGPGCEPARIPERIKQKLKG